MKAAGRKSLPLFLALLLGACGAPSEYFGIDIRPDAALTDQDPARKVAKERRDLLMLIAAVQGCYNREEGGLGPVPAAEASSFECARILAEVENRSAELGLGRAPSGIWALDLRTLARQAQGGDKNAQYELGVRFEEGIGLPQSYSNACRLFGKAAASSGGIIWIYLPPVGDGTTGQVIPHDTGPVIPGLSRARERLDALKQSGDC